MPFATTEAEAGQQQVQVSMTRQELTAVCDGLVEAVRGGYLASGHCPVGIGGAMATLARTARAAGLDLSEAARLRRTGYEREVGGGERA